MTVLVYGVFFLAAFLVCWMAVLRFDIQMFQQNSYRPERFIGWLKGHVLGHWRWLLILPPALLWNQWLTLVAVIVLLLYSWLEFRTRYKIPIVYTARVRRLYASTIVLGLLLIFLAWKFFGLVVAAYVASVVLLCSKALVLAAAFMNSPLEKAIGRWYYRDAEKILQAHKDLIIIGVTGSYGKTSTKNYLYRILSEKYNTLITPGNFNTTLGVVRTIREQLRPHHQVFIVEMGAKQVGDIREICDLVHPQIGIVTSVGDMHLETFGSRENIQKTKFELIRALPADGLGVINMDSEGIASYADVPGNCPIVRYGVHAEGLNYRARDIVYTAGGTDFTVQHADSTLQLHTSLVGDSNVLNILAALAVADRLGVSPRQQTLAVAKLQQVEHRLFVSQKGGLTILDDAYNSNPEGARMALQVMRQLRLPEGGRRIVVTPGFVELGRKQEAAGLAFGAQIAEAADWLIIVNKLNREAIRKGARDAGMKKDRIILADTLEEAVERLRKIAQPGDAVLYENDLPDTFK